MSAKCTCQYFLQSFLVILPHLHIKEFRFIVSGSYRNEVRTVTVTQAKVVALEIKMRDITPTARLALPVGTQAYCDGTRVEDTKKPLKLEQGRHSFRFVLGGYEISKQVDMVNGHNYTVSLNIDASVSEEE